MRTNPAIAATACVVALVATIAPAMGQSSSPMERGQAMAAKHCARCHSIRVEGDSPLAQAPPFRVLPQRYPLEQLEEALAEGIVTGHPEMPRFTFSPVEINALLTFMDSLDQKPKAPPRKP